MQLLDVPPSEEKGGYVIKASTGKMPESEKRHQRPHPVVDKVLFVSFAFDLERMGSKGERTLF